MPHVACEDHAEAELPGKSTGTGSGSSTCREEITEGEQVGAAASTGSGTGQAADNQYDEGARVNQMIPALGHGGAELVLGGATEVGAGAAVDVELSDGDAPRPELALMIFTERPAGLRTH